MSDDEEHTHGSKVDHSATGGGRVRANVRAHGEGRQGDAHLNQSAAVLEHKAR